MWNVFIITAWLIIPVSMFVFFVIYQLKELKTSALIKRAPMFLQATMLTAFCVVIAILLNQFVLTPHLKPIILNFTDKKYIFEVIQFLSYPALLMLLAPFSGKTKSPETQHDKIQKQGYIGLIKKGEHKKTKI